ncbi:MAG: hypothetical protein ACTII7_09670 [Galactobacter sp.]
MSVILLGSLGHSPGISTTALAMAMNWPRPVVLVEADTTKPSSVLAGFLRATQPARTGLNTLSALTAQNNLRLSRSAVFSAAVPLTETSDDATQKHLLHAFSKPSVGRGANRLWGELAETLLGLDEAGIDVIVDYGRFQNVTDRRELLRRADYVLWGVRATLPDIAATQATLTEATDVRDVDGRAEHQGLLIFDPATGAYPSGEIAKLLGTNTLGTIPHQPTAAAYYSQGADFGRSLPARKLDRAITPIITEIRQRLNDIEAILRPEANET